MDERQINRWANRAMENLRGGWYALAEHQVGLIIEATGGMEEPPRVHDHWYHGNGAQPCTFNRRVESERTYCERPKVEHER